MRPAAIRTTMNIYGARRCGHAAGSRQIVHRAVQALTDLRADLASFKGRILVFQERST
jgi:hypothetical protein